MAYNDMNANIAAAGRIGGSAATVTKLSPVMRLTTAVEAAEKTAAMIHQLRVGMMGDVPDVATAEGKEYHGEGLIGRIGDAAARVEAATARILRDLEDMHRAYGDF